MTVLAGLLILVFLASAFWSLITLIPFPWFKAKRKRSLQFAGISFALTLTTSFFAWNEPKPTQVSMGKPNTAQVASISQPVQPKSTVLDKKSMVQQQFEQAQKARRLKAARKKVEAQQQFERAQQAAREKQRQRQETARVEKIRLERVARLAAAIKALLDAEPSPVAAEIVSQTSSDNYGIEPYFVLTDSSDKEIGSTGKARLVLTVKSYLTDSETTVYDKVTLTTYASFSIGTRGIGAFKRDAVFYRLGKISTEQFSGKSGTAYLTFTSHRGEVVKAKDSIFYP